jgi:hypothetical protein
MKMPSTPLRLVARFAFAALALHAAAAQADPMRPLPTAAAATPGATAPNLAAVPVAGQPALASDRLVAIRRNSDGRLQALIGEQWVAVGERVGGRAGNATLRALSETGATLALGRQQLVLQLLPQLVLSRDEAPAAERRSGATPLASLQRSRPSPPSRSTSTP